ncbi:MAG: glycosyltransferase family 2 protein [candidate division KSB1 bacterium]|nr:glycosyltransferase family 2 protein [candidate division KSB1 bacterium]
MKGKADGCALSVVVPLYNEAESLEPLYREIVAAADKSVPSFEIIFVDDGSCDDSLARLRRLAAQDSRVKVISLRSNCGKSAALAVGFAHVQGESVITMDGDLQDDPAEIPRLLATLEQGWDLVSGWKKKRHDPWRKRWSSKWFNLVTSMLSGLRLHDFNCGLKAYRREVVRSIRVYGQLHRFLPVLAHWQGFRVTEQVVHHRPRRFGKTKFGPWRFFAGFFDLLTVMFLMRFNRRPMHLFGFLGLLCFTAGSIITLYLAIMRLFYAVYLSNRPLLFLGILLTIVGIQFVSIGLLGEMIAESRAADRGYPIRLKIGWDEPPKGKSAQRTRAHYSRGR